jgi:ABC-type uncharacterized transport system involved in gliding motility auxiliary subunit
MATRDAGVTSRPLMDTLRLPLAALGIFGLLAGLGVWLIEGQFNQWARILVAGGILLLGVVVALDPRDIWERITGRGALFSGNALIIAAAAFGILGLVNVLGSRYQTKWDLTATKQFTLSEQSIRVAETLPQPVKLTAYFQAGDPQRTEYEGLLSEYALRSGGKLTFEFIDPVQRPGEARAAGITQEGTTVFQMGDKKQNSTGSQERDITTALIKLTRPEKKVYFTTGHGERRLEGFDPGDYAQVKQALERDNFRAETLNLATSRTVPDDAAAIIIAGPTNPFRQEEKDALRAYLDGGGSLFVLMSPSVPNAPNNTDLNDLLAKWEVGFTKNVVIETRNALQGDPLVPATDTYKFHTTTSDLRLLTIYPNATNVSYPGQSPGGSSVTPLVETTDQSWSETNFQQLQQTVQQRGALQPDEADQKGPLALAAAIEQEVTSGQASGGSEGQNKRTTRIVLVGTAEFAANWVTSTGAGNLDLFLNAANWLAEQDDLVSIRPRQDDTRQLLLTGTQQNLIFYSSVLFLPLSVLAAGLVVWWARR